MTKEEKKERITLIVQKLTELDESDVDSYVAGYIIGRIDGKNAEREKKHTVNA